jgi:hypothetical protein
MYNITFQNWRGFLVLMINLRKIIKNIYNTLSAFNSNAHLTFKIMNFEDVFLKNIIHFYMVKSMDA